MGEAALVTYISTLRSAFACTTTPTRAPATPGARENTPAAPATALARFMAASMANPSCTSNWNTSVADPDDLATYAGANPGKATDNHALVLDPSQTFLSITPV